MGGQNSSIRGEPEEGDLKSALLMHVAREEARQDADDAIPTSGIINIPDNIPVPQLVSSSLSQFGFLEPLHESVPVLGTTASEGRAARHGDTYYNAPLSFGEELGWAAGLGLAGGLFTAVYSITLQQILRVVWDTVPEKLASSGLWTQDSAVPLQGYIVVAAVTLSVLGCLLATALPPHENISAWIGKVHTHGVAPIAWAAPMVVVSLLTVPSGASIGPEGVMIVAGGNLAGWLGSRLGRGVDVTRWFSLVGASACVSSFFGLPLAGSFFVLSMLHSTGEPQHYEALKGALVASTVCCALSRALVPPPPAPREDAWMFPPPGAVPYWEALLAGVVFGALGSLLSFATSITDKLINWMVGRLKLTRLFMMAVAAVIFSVVCAMRPALLFWSEMQIPYALGNEDPLPILSPLLQQGASSDRQSSLPIDLILQGLAKAVFAGMVKAAKFPGGIIFPMVFAGGCLGMGVMQWLQYDIGLSWAPLALAPVAVMAAAQSAVNRTPWASILLVVDSHAGGPEVSTKVALIAAVVVAELLTWGSINMFPTQQPRAKLAPSCQKNVCHRVSTLPETVAAPAVTSSRGATAEEEQEEGVHIGDQISVARH